MNLIITKNNTIIGENIVLADTFWLRLAGLIPKKNLQQGEGLLIRPCRQIHTWFMSFPIDVIFLNKGNQIVHLIPEMKPRKLSPFIKQGLQVLELPSASITVHELKIGDKLVF
ncbi:MAG: DUF192 domain-containing protein [Clostridia bacterium]|nr:DUF192 domain-containing protein [Clostridia bacterium]MDD4047554.1 DUF192 domain-containing protein [Clostridia bacterium]